MATRKTLDVVTIGAIGRLPNLRQDGQSAAECVPVLWRRESGPNQPVAGVDADGRMLRNRAAGAAHDVAAV